MKFKKINKERNTVEALQSDRLGTKRNWKNYLLKQMRTIRKPY